MKPIDLSQFPFILRVYYESQNVLSYRKFCLCQAIIFRNQSIMFCFVLGIVCAFEISLSEFLSLTVSSLSIYIYDALYSTTDEIEFRHGNNVLGGRGPDVNSVQKLAAPYPSLFPFFLLKNHN